MAQRFLPMASRARRSPSLPDCSDVCCSKLIRAFMSAPLKSFFFSSFIPPSIKFPSGDGCNAIQEIVYRCFMAELLPSQINSGEPYAENHFGNSRYAWNLHVSSICTNRRATDSYCREHRI